MRHIAIGPHPTLAQQIFDRVDRTRFRPWAVALDEVDLDRVDAAIPLTFDHYDALRRRLPPARRRFVIPSAALVALCDDKPALAAWLTANGFAGHVPQVYDAAPPFPHIVKPRHGQFGEGCRVVADPADAGDAPGCFRQALVPGEAEYACHLLRVDGVVRYARTIRYRMAGPHEVRSATNPPVAAVFDDGGGDHPLLAGMLAALDYQGTACVNYKRAGATPMILEINPRFGGSLIHDIDAYLAAYLAALAG